MSKLKSIIGNRKPKKEDWHALAIAWGVNSDYQLADIAPPDVTCKLCWDLNVCAECLGEYPEACPAMCGDGSCYDHVARPGLIDGTAVVIERARMRMVK